METESKDDLQQETKNEEPLNYHSPNMPSEWQINGTNIPNSSMGLIPPTSSNNPMAFCPNIWDQPSCSQNLDFCEMNLQQNAGVSPSLTARNSMPGPLGGVMGWAPPQHPMLRGGGVSLPTVPGLHPQSLAQIQADSGFIERAARFSCFSAGNFADIVNPFSVPEPPNPYSRLLAPMQRPQIFAGSNTMNSMQGMQSQGDEINMLNSKGATVQVDHGTTTLSPLKSKGKSEILARSHDEGKQGTNGASELVSDEAEFSGRDGAQVELEGTVGPSSGKGLGSKKRKKTGQDSKIDEYNRAGEPCDEAANNHTEIQQNEDQNTTSTATKPGGKNGNPDPSTSDQPKEEYIHIRARRGQATNSHSLAERVRREKISERMKFLQDLVPGCSKVTGKAVMLDEIINYVQSLQRQVEFLSMKLATVNPRLDIDIESLFSKDIHQLRAGPSSSLVFPHDLTMSYHPPLHPSPPGPIQAGLLGMGGSFDALRRFMTPEFPNMGGGYKEPTPQGSSWEDELHNVIQMGLNSAVPQSSQDLSAPLPSGNMKAEM